MAWTSFESPNNQRTEAERQRLISKFREDAAKVRARAKARKEAKAREAKLFSAEANATVTVTVTANANAAPKTIESPESGWVTTKQEAVKRPIDIDLFPNPPKRLKLSTGDDPSVERSLYDIVPECDGVLSVEQMDEFMHLFCENLPPKQMQSLEVIDDALSVELVPETESSPFIDNAQWIEWVPSTESTPFIEKPQWIEMAPATESAPLNENDQWIEWAPVINEEDNTQWFEMVPATESVPYNENDQWIELVPVNGSFQVIEKASSIQMDSVAEPSRVIDNAPSTEMVSVAESSPVIDNAPVDQKTIDVEYEIARQVAILRREVEYRKLLIKLFGCCHDVEQSGCCKKKRNKKKIAQITNNTPSIEPASVAEPAPVIDNAPEIKYQELCHELFGDCSDIE